MSNNRCKFYKSFCVNVFKKKLDICKLLDFINKVNNFYMSKNLIKII